EEGKDESNDLLDDEPKDDSDVVGRYGVDNGAALQRLNASLYHGVKTSG
ncbi:hypothetical protein Tco_0387915, partial [Tanacetum coccineum]